METALNTSLDQSAESPAVGRMARTRRGFIGALLAAIGSALAIGMLWLFARDAPSAGRDPAWPPDSGE